MGRFLLICLGGAVGTGARYVLAGWAAQVLGTAFPFGTLIVNVTGSFALALLMHIGTTTEVLSPVIRLALATGVMGGFTTYSTFNYETTAYMREGAWLLASANVLLTVVTCFLAGLLGLAVGRLLAGH